MTMIIVLLQLLQLVRFISRAPVTLPFCSLQVLISRDLFQPQSDVVIVLSVCEMFGTGAVRMCGIVLRCGIVALVHGIARHKWQAETSILCSTTQQDRT